MDRNEGVEDVERDVDGFPIAQGLLAVGVLVERLAVDELGDQVPVTGRRSCQPRKTSTTWGCRILRSAPISRRTAS